MNFHPTLKSNYSNWKDLEKQIEQLPTTKSMGDVFEQFVYVYLLIKRDLYQIDKLFMYEQIPLDLKKKYHLEKNDCGVDGLIILRNGKTAAYQAKFRTNREKPSYEELTKFWAEARHTDYHYTISNCYELSRLCEKHDKHLRILVDEFDALPSEFFTELYQICNEKKPDHKLYSPDDYQKRMIINVLKGFEKNDRGKLIAASGIGKTLTSLWISEQMKAQKILFIAPSLALIKQTLESWAEQARAPFSYLCVCSDKSVSEIDDGDIAIADSNVPVTTNPDDICEGLNRTAGGKIVIFCTYQSLDVLAKGLRKLTEYKFDLTIFDEAHRTAGTSDSGLFSLALHDQSIPSRKRLFMTATERLVRPSIVQKAKDMNRVVFSMDDENLYGPVFDRFSFGEAIKNKIISDYRIIVAGIKNKEIYQWISSNKLLVNIAPGSEEYLTYAQNIFRQTMLVKAMKEFSIKKCITFHSTVKNAHGFINGVSSKDLSLKVAFSKLWPELDDTKLYFDHLNGEMSAGERRERLDLFKAAMYGIISNARCLTEGVDVPIIDSIYFVNPKSSLIDIVQACGRALRKPRDKHDKMAYFIVPILLPDSDDAEKVINEIDFEMLHNLIQSLRNQDQRMEQWIDHLVFDAVKGKTRKFTSNDDSPVVLALPTEFDVKSFEQNLYLKIAEVNGEPTQITSNRIRYGKKDRKSDYKRIFKTLGDLSVETYKSTLVIPTIKKFHNATQELTASELKINHNNVSHTERLGLIYKSDRKYRLTPLGVQFYQNKQEFKEIFKRQMLRYFSVAEESGRPRILFPYRAALKVLKETKSINYYDFLFGLYSLIDSSDESIQDAIESINRLRKDYPNIELVNNANQPKLLKELNDRFETIYSATDIWEKKTTTYNQYIYIRDHLTQFDDYVTTENARRIIEIAKGGKADISKLLKLDDGLEREADSRKLFFQYTSALALFVMFSLSANVNANI